MAKTQQIPVPWRRPRRLRGSETIRSMVRETVLTPADFIYPLFVTEHEGVRKEISSMPGQYQLSLDYFVEELHAAAALGIKSCILFGIPKHKDPDGQVSLQANGIVQKAIAAAKNAVPGMLVMTDVCMCEYTDHGHCGPVVAGDVDNDTTLSLIAAQAVSHAKAGADLVAPSGMMDGMVGAIRSALDGEGFEKLPIMSYAVKYASSFYGPFREAAESAPQFGDRRSYQMDAANSREAMIEAALDVDEGADILMVKPAMAFMDIIAKVKDNFDLPVASYNVSGEYSMVKAAAAKGWIDEESTMMEILTGLKRAGSDMILTYFAKDAARVLGG